MKNLYLEFVRGMAAIIVVAIHFVELWPPAFKSHFSIIYWGTDSVMIFFILSGCVINMSQTLHPRSRSLFLVNRMIRLYPQFIVGILLGLLVFYLLKMTIPGPKVILGNLLMLDTLQGYIVKTFRANSPIWSLSFEMCFYLLFALTIGRNQKKMLIGWLLLSLAVMPLYYFKPPLNIVGHLIAVLAFSSIWLVGYFVYEYRKSFYVDSYAAFLSAGLLPLVSRIELTQEYYDPLRYLLFAIVAIPFFRFCLQTDRQGKKLSVYYLVLAYALLLPLLFLTSSSQHTLKYLCAFLPAGLCFCNYLIRVLKIKSNAVYLVNRLGAVTGKYSYSLYIFHFPVIFFCSRYFHSFPVYVAVSVIVFTLLVVAMETFLQPAIIRLTRPSAAVKKPGLSIPG